MTRFLVRPALLLALAAPVLLAGCQSAADAAPADAPATATTAAATADPATVRAEIEARSALYQTAGRAGDVAALQALHADDAVLLPPNKPAVRGRAAVDAYLAEDPQPDSSFTLTVVDVQSSAAGDLAYEVGTYVTRSGAPSKYVTIHRRTADGWEIVLDAWNRDIPPAGTN